MTLKCTGYLGCDPATQEPYAEDGKLRFMRCRSCGLIWRDPESMHLVREYDHAYFDSKNYLKNRDHKIRKSGWLIDLARAFHPGVNCLLEVGCSLGNTLEAARERGIAHLGTDVSPFATEYCRSRGLRAETLSLEEVYARGERFDLIFMQHVLEHFEDPFQTLDLCGKLLLPGGLLLIVVPNARYGRAEKGRQRHRFYSRQGVGMEHYVYFDYSSLNRVLRKTGFEVVRRNYPLLVRGFYSVPFLLNRLFRRSLTLFHADQEIVVVARKI